MMANIFKAEGNTVTFTIGNRDLAGRAGSAAVIAAACVADANGASAGENEDGMGVGRVRFDRETNSNDVNHVQDAITDFLAPKRRVAAVEKGRTNCSWRFPVVWGRLECGHSCKVACYEASFGDPKEVRAKRDNKHDPDNWITQIGDLVSCRYCGFYRDSLAELKALDPATISHSRMRHGQVYVYAYDKTSPTGVSNVLNIDPSPEVDEVLRGRFGSGTTPLSPTEAR